MNRRSLVVGAAALAAIAGTRISTAHAASSGTIAHARSVLGLVNPDLGLVDPDTALTRLEAAFTAYEASPARDPDANDLHAWTEQRAADLIGPDTAQDLLDNPQTRALLGFAFLLYSQHHGRHPTAAITRGMPTPAGLATLEPDFFPELHRQIEIRARNSPAFADAIRAGAAELDGALDPTAEAAAQGSGRSATRQAYQPSTLSLVIAFIAGVYGVIESIKKLS
jgi:hypothetical protein